MKYAVVKAGKDWNLETGLLGHIESASGIIAAKKAAIAQYGKNIILMMESERQYLVSKEFAAKVKAAK